MSTSTSATTTVPDVALAATVVCDAELALLGVLAPGQLLGGPIVSAPVDSDPLDQVDGSAQVRLALPADLAERVLDAGSAVLRDEEWTPLALLSDVALVPAERPDDDARVLRGRLARLRTREAGFRRSAMLQTSDAAGPGERVRMVVLRRPPVGVEHEALAAGEGFARTLVVVPAGPGAGDEVPPAVLLEVATALSEQWPSRVELRVAPLAWRDERSDEQLVHRLAERMGVRQVDYLRPDGADHGATTWRSLLGALDAGREDSLTGLDPHARESLLRWRPPRTRRGLVMVFSGLSGSGKSTLARAVADGVRAGGRTVSLLDGDVVRTLLSSGLGFDRAGRELNLQRIGWVAAEIARHGGVAICAPIAPYEQSRAAMRAMALEHGGFVLVHVSTPLEECERRDLKGLYAKARAGLITEFTGVSDPYETPTDADLTIDTTDIDPPSAADAVLAYLRDEGWLPRSPA